MSSQEILAKADFIGLVANEAVDESDAVERHPEIIDLLRELASDPSLPGLFGDNGHDPVAFVSALAEGLEPYREAELVEAPELVSGLGLLAETLRHGSGL